MGKGKGQGACIQVAKGWKALNMTQDVQQCCEHCCTTCCQHVLVVEFGSLSVTPVVGWEWSVGELGGLRVIVKTGEWLVSSNRKPWVER